MSQKACLEISLIEFRKVIKYQSEKAMLSMFLAVEEGPGSNKYSKTIVDNIQIRKSLFIVVNIVQ